jgi:hypothetical protein
MRIERLIFLPVVAVLLYMVSHHQAAAQVENVPAEHPVYEYLHRMEVKRILPKFNRTVAPVSRQRIAGYLRDVMVRTDELSTVERNLLNLYRIEFAHDLDDGRARATDLFGEGGLYGGLTDLFTFKQRYLYHNPRFVFYFGLQLLGVKKFVEYGEVKKGETENLHMFP